jgi:hypothetical protein
MSKIVASLALIFTMTILAFAKPSNDKEVIIKLGFQPQSEVSLNGNNESMKIGMSGGFEFFSYLHNIIALGLGTTLDLPKETKKEAPKGGSAWLLPMYAGVKVRTPLHGLNDTFAFLSGNAGWSFLMEGKGYFESATGGLYLAAGFGISIEYFFLEVVCAKHNLSSLSYSTVSLYLGYRVQFC